MLNQALNSIYRRKVINNRRYYTHNICIHSHFQFHNSKSKQILGMLCSVTLTATSNNNKTSTLLGTTCYALTSKAT